MSTSRSAAPAPLASSLLLALLALAGCEGDTADLVREINEARQGCTQEKLQAGDEECVQMMQRYAEMGTEALQTYIGAVRSLDQALQRMPPAQFDTAGLGHAITPSRAPATALLGDSLSRVSADMAWDSDYGTERAPRPRREDPYVERRWRDQPEEVYDARQRLEPEYGPRGYDPREHDPREYDRRGYDPREYDRRGYDPRYGPGGYGTPPVARRGQWEDPRWSDSRTGWDDPRQQEWDERWEDPRARLHDRGRYEPPAPERGRMLPPEQRLRRPWIRDERPVPRGSRTWERDTLQRRELPPRPTRVPQH